MWQPKCCCTVGCASCTFKFGGTSLMVVAKCLANCHAFCWMVQGGLGCFPGCVWAVPWDCGSFILGLHRVCAWPCTEHQGCDSLLLRQRFDLPTVGNSWTDSETAFGRVGLLSVVDTGFQIAGTALHLSGGGCSVTDGYLGVLVPGQTYSLVSRTGGAGT
jgi:hypothetical protein